MKCSGSLVLSDGMVFSGTLFSKIKEPILGEIVFSTAMTGYVEILSDPSFFHQIIVLANAEIGNYGVCLKDLQSSGIKATALVVRNFSLENYGGADRMALIDWLNEAKVPVLADIDTRALISHIREAGAMMAAIADINCDSRKLFAMAREAPTMEGMHLSPQVSVREPTIFAEQAQSDEAPKFKVVVIDFGVKYEILRCLNRIGAEVIIVPSDYSAEKIKKLNPDGICLSNGPGDPKMESKAVKTVQELLGKFPIFGICLGHQILAQALGIKTYKLKSGHRGSNQPVLSPDGKVIITAQNHGFAVQTELARAKDCGHNLNDNTNEALNLPELHAFSVQFHPEGAPGPEDAFIYFDNFASAMKAGIARLWLPTAKKELNL